MLNIIYGRAATGKTTSVFEKIKSDIENGKRVVLIIPEQFSFESERMTLSVIGDDASNNLEVLSFSRLCSEVERIVGKSAVEVLSDAEKIMMMNKALNLTADKIPQYKKYLSSPSFARKMLDTVCELKTSAVFPNDIDSITERIDDSQLKEKVKAISDIYKAYDFVLADKFIDPVDKLTLLYENLDKTKCNYFDNKQVYIDSFAGFTGQQKRIIERILTSTNCDLTVSLLIDELDSDKINLFKNTRDTAKDLIETAKKHFVKVGNIEKKETPFYKYDDVKELEKIIAFGKRESGINAKNITVVRGTSAYDEAVFTARKIRNMVRTENYRYRDFAVIARNTETYETYFKNECEKNNIYCFSDKKVPLSSTPLFSFINCALNAQNGYSSEDIMSMLKTGLTAVSVEEIYLLENYVYLWNINGKQWLNEWSMSVKGFTDEELKESEKEKLKEINRVRKAVVMPLIKLQNSIKNSERSEETATAIVNFLCENKVGEKLSDLYNSLPFGISKEEKSVLLKSYKAVMDVLESIVKCSGEHLSLDEFKKMFTLASSITDIGAIPQMIDEVIFGDAERIRPSRPKAVFVLGANSGVFPAVRENTTLLCNNDRKKLRNSGLVIKDKSVSDAIDENMLVYTSVCPATEKVFVLYSENSEKGKLERSEFLEDIISSFSAINILSEPNNELNDNNLPETLTSAFSEFCRTDNKNNSRYSTIKSVLETKDGFKEKIERINEIPNRDIKEISISKETAKKFFSKNEKISASRFETYHKCNFSYFCKYILGVKEIEPASFDVLQRGTVIHYILEGFINRHKDNISKIDTSKIRDEAKELCEEYLQKVPGFNETRSKRTEYILSVIIDGAAEMATRMAEEFAQSDFTPLYCELKIGNDKAVNGFKLPFGDDSSVIIEGSVDRVDTYNGYVRVVDYKSGSKEFELSDVLFGLNMQMLIYLYAVTKAENSPVKGNEPAGILYMLSNSSKKDKTAMNGIIVQDENIAKAMEDKNEGVFVPKFEEKSKSHISKSDFSSVFGYIDTVFRKTGNDILSGRFGAYPYKKGQKTACDYCHYQSVCNIEDGELREIPRLSNDDAIQLMKGETDNG